MPGMATTTSINSSNEAGLAPTLAALALLGALGTAALWQATLGFEVISTEDGRRLAVARQPVAAPDVAVHAPQADTLAHLLGADGRVAIASFIYSGCNAVCAALGSECQQLQQAIVQRGLLQQVRLLSISFDPRDTPAVLAQYSQRQHADPRLWRMVSVDRQPDRQALLDAFGVVVLPAPMGEYQHNAAFHLLDRRGAGPHHGLRRSASGAGASGGTITRAQP
jgi:protein SCO1/2